ncbi:hypothetical protein BDZ94DRAFT_1313212 [Collybia nuda]|uniref:BTB domain-containing protein n=1 Tax=Collybia nuda TaxID=64659 RepID=A0A9P5XWU9_9AGAR|nr:hypothetical protein BDZ94DRAFT_1313212 [Collybia nuda]
MQSTTVGASDADITFKSFDDVLFNIHRKNLEVATGALLPSDVAIQVNGPTVSLNELSETLEFMFQFIYPMLQPDIASLPFKVLEPLAEAVEKYRVFPAMVICKINMRKFLHEHVDEVVRYAARHGYTDIVDEAAPLLLTIPLKEVLLRLPTILIVPWALYYSAWDQALCLARSLLKISDMEKLRKSHCGGFGSTDYRCPIDEIICGVLLALNSVGTLQNLASVNTTGFLCCREVDSCLDKWREAVEAELEVEDEQSVALSESSIILELMFQFIYPMHQPDVPLIPFETLAPLTEAVEKYEVFPASPICKIYMRKSLPERVQEIMGLCREAPISRYRDGSCATSLAGATERSFLPLRISPFCRTSTLQQSALFNSSDADVVFRSADNVLFNIHRKNLEVATGAFPPSNFSTQGESVALSESSTTLELMFQYIYPMPQPEAPSLPFETLAPLAEAV